MDNGVKKEFDSDGLLLCELQGKAFELSLSQMETSSEVFIRRYMYSSAAKLLDNGMALIRITLPQDLLDFVNEQYGISSYGSGELPPLTHTLRSGSFLLRRELRL